jgi:hypothetical protein
VDGFAEFTPASGVWSWLGGGFDVTAAETVFVREGEGAYFVMTAHHVDWMSVAVADSYWLASETDVIIHAAIERNGRLELIPVGTVRSSGDLVAPVSAWVPFWEDLTLFVPGDDEHEGVWLGDDRYGVHRVEDARIESGYSIGRAQLQWRVKMQLGVPLVAGTAVVGQILTADHPVSPIVPAEAGDQTWHYSFGEFTYEWFADGKRIEGEISQDLRVTSAMAGKRIAFRVTASEDGFAPATATSLATPRVTAPAVPKITYSLWPNVRLSPGTWPAGTSLRYQWLSGSGPVPGATGTEFTVTDGSGAAAALVTATRAGYESALLSVTTHQSGMAVHALRTISAVASEYPAAHASGTLRGYVIGVDSPTNVMLPGARVRVYRTGTGLTPTTLTFVKELVSDAGGRFSLTGLAPGSYCTVVTSPNPRYGPVDNCHEDLRWSGVRVFANAESDATVGLRRSGHLRGTVTSSTGAKVSGAIVDVYRPHRDQGVLSFIKVTSTRTDSAGQYSLPGMEWNSFHLKFSGPSSLSHRATWWGANDATGPRGVALWVDQDKTTTANMTLPEYLPIGIPSITGAANVGSTLSAKHPITSGAKYAYQWYANGVAIKGATARSLKLSTAQHGTAISVRVVGSGSSYLTTTRNSPKTPKVLRSSSPTIGGVREVGRVLSAQVGTWTTGTTFSYQWYRNGVAITGARSRLYVVAKADIGDRLSVRVQGKKTGYATIIRASAQTTTILR